MSVSEEKNQGDNRTTHITTGDIVYELLRLACPGEYDETLDAQVKVEKASLYPSITAEGPISAEKHIHIGLPPDGVILWGRDVVRRIRASGGGGVRFGLHYHFYGRSSGTDDRIVDYNDAVILPGTPAVRAIVAVLTGPTADKKLIRLLRGLIREGKVQEAFCVLCLETAAK